MTNYDKLMQETVSKLDETGKPVSILLHSCCAPCSSSVIKRLSDFFKITVFYYNPNIDTVFEYERRAAEQRRLLQIYNKLKISPYNIEFLELGYESRQFDAIAKGRENCREGGERCIECYKLRLKKTAEEAEKRKFCFFCSTLSVSPLKNVSKINEIGESFSVEGCKWLFSDFKKRNGYLESIQLSKEFGLYRQDYCGCVFSLRRQKLNSEEKNV